MAILSFLFLRINDPSALQVIRAIRYSISGSLWLLLAPSVVARLAFLDRLLPGYGICSSVVVLAATIDTRHSPARNLSPSHNQCPSRIHSLCCPSDASTQDLTGLIRKSLSNRVYPITWAVFATLSKPALALNTATSSVHTGPGMIPYLICQVNFNCKNRRYTGFRSPHLILRNYDIAPTRTIPSVANHGALFRQHRSPVNSSPGAKVLPRLSNQHRYQYVTLRYTYPMFQDNVKHFYP